MRHLKIWDILSGAEDNYIPPHLLISPYNADVRFSTDFFSSRVSVKRTKPSLILLQPQINSEKKWHRQASNTPDPKKAKWPTDVHTTPALCLGTGECQDDGTFQGGWGSPRPCRQWVGGRNIKASTRLLSEARRSQDMCLKNSHLEGGKSQASQHRTSISVTLCTSLHTWRVCVWGDAPQAWCPARSDGLWTPGEAAPLPQTRYSLGALSPRRPFSPNPRDWEWAPRYPRRGRQGAPPFPPNSLTPSPLSLSPPGVARCEARPHRPAGSCLLTHPPSRAAGTRR